MPPDSKLEQEVAALGDLSRDELAARWTKAYGCPPPKGLKRGLLERAAAWHLQHKVFGGLSPEGRRALKSAVRQYEQQLEARRKRREDRGDVALPGSRSEAAIDGVPAVGSLQIGPGGERGNAAGKRGRQKIVLPKPRLALAPGARLLREWNGRQHFVEVVENGYVLDGKTYRSLSAIARRITGAHWSGPRFFGL